MKDGVNKIGKRGKSEMLYFNTKTKLFETLKNKSKSAAKILLTEKILIESKTGTYGPDELPGRYISTINGIDFYWDALEEVLVDGYGIRIHNPDNLSFGECAFLD
jgi:hypothetical protein